MSIRNYPDHDLNLLRKEIESIGELLNQEKLERRSEIDLLKMKFEALKKSIGQELSNFREKYEEIEKELVQNFDPETGSSHQESPYYKRTKTGT